jgi:Holliday junction DNA helicase RuvA
MIASISGTVKSSSINSAIIEVGGVGLLVSLPTRVATRLVLGSFVTLFTSLIVREDSLSLFGFEDQESQAMFDLLQTVSGIGPKVAQSAISVYEVEEITLAIRNEEAAILERIPGLGKKGAARILLELKEKVGGFTAGSRSIAAAKASWRGQLEEALSNLGFGARDISSTLDALASEVTSGEEVEISALLRRALQILGSRG